MPVISNADGAALACCQQTIASVEMQHSPKCCIAALRLHLHLFVAYSQSLPYRQHRMRWSKTSHATCMLPSFCISPMKVMHNTVMQEIVVWLYTSSDVSAMEPSDDKVAGMQCRSAAEGA